MRLSPTMVWLLLVGVVAQELVAVHAAFSRSRVSWVCGGGLDGHWSTVHRLFSPRQVRSARLAACGGVEVYLVVYAADETTTIA